MSDDEYVYSDDEDGDYQYSDGGEEEEGGGQSDYAIEVENAFYEADDKRRDNPRAALSLFEKVVQLEKDNRPDEVKWRFKSLEHMVVLHHRLGQGESMLEVYQELLRCLDKVTRNECNDTINHVLDTVSAGAGPQGAQISLGRMYEITLDVLRAANNERLWFNTNLKLGKMLLDQGDYVALEKVIGSLHESLETGQSKDDPNRDAYLLEVYALEIAMYSATRQKAKLKEIWPKTQSLSAAIQDPRIFGGLREAGGKMRMEEEAWSEAYDEFFESFRNYQEAGNPRAKQCLKYVVLANMIALKDINPFDSREAKVYKDDPEIKAMMELRSAYESSDVKEFERLLNDQKLGIANDPFIMRYINDLLHNIRSQVLMIIVRPYKRVHLDFLAREINVTTAQVEEILVQLILDHRISARVDQRLGILEKYSEHVDSKSTSLGDGEEPPTNVSMNRKFAALSAWASSLRAIQTK